MLDTPPQQNAGHIRSFTSGDAAAVARLLTFAFKHSDAPPPEALINYLRHAYLDIPWFDPEIAPRVAIDADGRVAGFVGVSAMPMRLGDRTIRTAVLSSFAVDTRIADPTTGPRLLRDIRSGVQDAVLNDRSNAISVALMRSLGGETLPGYSLDWLRPIRPLGLAIDYLAERFGPARLLQPLAGPLDNAALKRSLASTDPHWLTPGHSRAAEALADREIGLDELAQVVPSFLDAFGLRPIWSEADLAALLADAARKPLIGDFHARLVTNRAGTPLGAFLLHTRRGHIAQVLQILAGKGREGAVIDRAIMFARDHGAVAIRGRVQPALLEPLMDRRAVFLPAFATVVYSRDAEVLRHFREGTAFFTGLAGENWMRLNGDDFQSN